MTLQTLAALPPRHRTARARTWWGKAWVRAVEESAYAESDLRAGRAAARAGLVGGIAYEPGHAYAAVRTGDQTCTASLKLSVLTESEVTTLVELADSVVGRIPDLLNGELPHDLIEDAEESGLEVLPYGGEFEASCTCEAWTQPCLHALALLSQLAWWIDDDPFILLHLRGLPRSLLLSRPDYAADLEVAYVAVMSARAALFQAGH